MQAERAAFDLNSSQNKLRRKGEHYVAVPDDLNFTNWKVVLHTNVHDHA